MRRRMVDPVELMTTCVLATVGAGLLLALLSWLDSACAPGGVMYSKRSVVCRMTPWPATRRVPHL